MIPYDVYACWYQTKITQMTTLKLSISPDKADMLNEVHQMSCSLIIPGCISHPLPLSLQVLALLSLLPQAALRCLHGTRGDESSEPPPCKNCKDDLSRFSVPFLIPGLCGDLAALTPIPHDGVTGVEHAIPNQGDCARRMMGRPGTTSRAFPRQHQSSAAQASLPVARPFSAIYALPKL